LITLNTTELLGHLMRKPNFCDLLIVFLFVFFSPQFVWGDVSHIVAQMPADTWMEVPNTRLVDVAADPNQFPFLVRSSSNISNIFDYSGAVFDTKRNQLVIWGGGHNSYDGNEVYAFDVMSLTWKRLTDPSEPNTCQQVSVDGTPTSRHTYNGMAYIEHADRFFATGGALACYSGGCGANITWIFDFTTAQWSNRNPLGMLPTTTCENIAAYDPETRKVWWFDGDFSNANGLWSYDYDQNQWTKHNSDLITRRTATIDTKRGLLIVVGKGNVLSYGIREKNYLKQVWNTTGGEYFIGSQKPGLAYDPTTDRIVGWAGGSVYALNPDTKIWTQHSAEGAPSTEAIVGVYGLWRYVPSLNAFVVVTSPLGNVHFYKFSAGAGFPPPIDPVDILSPAPPSDLNVQKQ
jgi:hypothetical protein